MKLQIRYFLLIITTLFISCSQKSETLQEKLEKEFEQAKLKVAGRERNIQTAPDWKAKVYFKNSKAILIFEETMPELGFTSKRIYCDESGVEIEKIVYRKCLPNWKEQSYKLQDSTFIIFPKQNLVESYFENELVNSSKKVKFSERILKEAKYVKSQVE